MSNKILSVVENVTAMLNGAGICASHGSDHAKCVMNNAIQALIHEKESNVNISDSQIEAVTLAALLHDVDDKKFFPNNKNYENLRMLISEYPMDMIDLVVRMVDLVSASKNGDSIPDDCKENMWMLIPRYADRLEAIGTIGITRCYQYTMTTNTPLFLENTLKFDNEQDILKESEKRYPLYNGNSDSMVDHYYDKLIGISVFPLKNVFFDKECEVRRKPLMDFLFYFNTHNDIDMTYCIKK